MFFVFGPGGQMFRGSADQLAQVGPVRRLQRTRAVQMQSTNIEENGPVPFFPPPQAPAPRPLAQDAVAAYTQTAQGPQEPRQPLTHVRDVMSRSMLTIPPDMPIGEAWQRLAERNLGQAPVTSPEGQVVGLLLRADMAPLELLPAPDTLHQALAQRAAAEVMVSPVPTVDSGTELRRVARVLIDADLPGLPVTDAAGQLEGFISRTDILRAVAADPPLDLWSGPRPVQRI